MKKKILMFSLIIFFFFGFCTITSIRTEELLIPQVSVIVPDYQDNTMLAQVPISCLQTEVNGLKGDDGKGIWSLQEYEDIWGNTEYQAVFVSNCILEEHETYVVVKDCPKLIIEDSLRPLQDKEKVRLIIK